MQPPRFGRAAVGEQGHRIVPHERRTHGGLDTQVGDDAAHHQVVDAEAAQQRIQRRPLERVEADLVDQQVAGPAAELRHHLGIPGSRGQAIDPGQRRAVPYQRPALVRSAGPVQVPGEDHRDTRVPGLLHRDGRVADRGLRALQAHADPRHRAVRVAEAVLHVDHDQRAGDVVIHGATSGSSWPPLSTISHVPATGPGPRRPVHTAGSATRGVRHVPVRAPGPGQVDRVPIERRTASWPTN